VGLADQEFPATELTARIRELVGSQPPDQRLLFLAADDRLNYEGVLRIVDLAKAGADDLKIGVIPVE
jgi:biopolymer transport protein ExbD